MPTVQRYHFSPDRPAGPMKFLIWIHGRRRTPSSFMLNLGDFYSGHILPTQTMRYYRGIPENYCKFWIPPKMELNYTTVKWLIVAAKPVSAWSATFQGGCGGEFHHISITWRVQTILGGDPPACISFRKNRCSKLLKLGFTYPEQYRTITFKSKMFILPSFILTSTTRSWCGCN